MNECYICTSITDEMSPCECKAHVHKKCLQTFQGRKKPYF